MKRCLGWGENGNCWEVCHLFWSAVAGRVRVSLTIGWVFTLLVMLGVLSYVKPGWETAIFVLTSLLVPVPLVKLMWNKWDRRTTAASLFELATAILAGLVAGYVWISQQIATQEQMLSLMENQIAIWASASGFLMASLSIWPSVKHHFRCKRCNSA